MAFHNQPAEDRQSEHSTSSTSPDFSQSGSSTTVADDKSGERSLESSSSDNDKSSNNGNSSYSTKEQKRTSDSWIGQYWWVIPLVGVAIALGGITFIRLRTNESPTVAEPSPLSVRAVSAEREPIRAWISNEGTVRAVEYQHLTFENEGDVTYLASINGRELREGDRVNEGDLLARIDDRELLADVQQAQASVAEARQQRSAAAADVAQVRSQVAQAQTQVQEAQAQLQNAQAARDLAATNVERYRFLADSGAVSQLEFDQRQNALEDARTQVRVAESRIASAEQQVASVRAQLSAAQQQVEARQSAITTAKAQLSQAEVALEGASIYAPIDGIIAYLNISEGEYFTTQVVTSQLAGDYQGLLERIPMVIIDPSQYEIRVDLAGPTGEQVQPGQSAFVGTANELADIPPQDIPYRQFLAANARAEGEVFSVNPAVSPGGRAIEARIRLNPATTSQDIRHGEQVLTWIAVNDNPNAVVVPLNAIVRRDQVPYVFVVDSDENVVEQREVELGITGITHQAIASGVEAGETVVTEGQNRLVDGASVQVVRPRNEEAL